MVGRIYQLIIQRNGFHLEGFDHIYGLRVVVRATVISLTLMNMGFTSTSAIFIPYKWGFEQNKQITALTDFGDTL
jgi:hypothetical protein